MSASFSGNASFSILFGSVARIGTVGGYTAYKSYVFLTTIGAVWAVLTTTRHLRGEEESGRWGLLLAGRTNAARVTGATIVGIVAATGITFGVTALVVAAVGTSGDVGLSLGGSVFFAAATVLPTVVFVGVGAVASQLARTRHLASTIGMGCFTVLFVLRMLGDAGTGLHWLLWTTPLGWAELVLPFTTNDPVPILAGLVLVLVLCSSALALAARRDAGAAVFSTDESRQLRPFGLGSPFGLAVRLAAPVTVAWAVGIVATAAVFGSVTDSVVQALATSNTMSTALTRLGGAGQGATAFLSVAFILLGTILALVPAHHISMARDEERSGRLALLLAGPVDRRRWLAGRIGFGVLTVVVLGPLAGLACWAGAVGLGASVALWPMVGAGVGIVPAALVALAVGACVFAVAPRAAPTSVELIVGWSLVIDLLGSLVTGLEPFTRLSLFHYVGHAPATPLDRVALASTTAVAVVIVAGALIIFGRRDLTAD